MEVNDFFKARSITSCMRASYDLITSNFKQVIKHTWSTSLPFAILGAIVLYFLLPNKALHDWGEMNPWMSFIIQTIVYGATIVMFFVTIFFANRMLKTSKTRTCKKKEAFWSILRHLGGYLMTCFLGGLICLILACITCLPAGIIATAQLYSQLGALDGDPLGVPAYFTPLLIVVLIATCYVLIHIIYWLYISLAYQYGSYKIQDEEKQKLKQRQEIATTEEVNA